MFFQGETGGNAGQEVKKNLTLADIDIKAMGQKFVNAFWPPSLINSISKVNEQTINMVRESMGQTNLIGRELEKTIGNATVKTLEFGVGVEDNINLFKSLNDAFRVNTFLTEDQVVNMQALAKNAGLTAEEMSGLIESFDTIGMGTNRALDSVNELEKRARTYGVNVGQYMRVMGENLKRLSTYNFRDGVEGFSKMVAQAQALRIDVEKTFNIAEGLLSPEKAIETAAQFNIIGGEFAKMADPFQLMYYAQNDVAALQDELVKAAAASATFNEETGEFDVLQNEIYRLSDAGAAVGMSMQEMSELAIKAAEKTKKLDLLEGMGEFNEEQKELLSNLAEIGPGGTMTLEYGNETLDLEKDSVKILENIQKIQEKADQEALSITDQQLPYLEKIYNQLQSAEFITTARGLQSDKLPEFFDELGNITSEVGDVLREYGEKIDFDAVFDFVLIIQEEMVKSLINKFQFLSQRGQRGQRTPPIIPPGGTPPTNAGPTSYLPSSIIGNPDKFLANLDNFTQQLSSNNNTNTVTPNNVDLKVDGNISLNLDGRNLPFNLSTEQIANALVNSPDFTTKITNIVLGKNNTYS